MKNHGNYESIWQDLAKNGTVRTWGWRVGIILLAMLWLAVIATAWSDADADAAGAEAAVRSRSDDSYDFKWLDPEKKIYVLQNRRYTKMDRPLLSVLGGPGFSNPYRNAWNAEVRAAYYFSEEWGIEAVYARTFNSPNTNYNALIGTNTNVIPLIRETNSLYGGLVHWVPWYSKINVFNSIFYFDWYFEGGLGSVQNSVSTTYTLNAPLEPDNELAYFLGTGHQYSVSESFIVRLDFMATFYRSAYLTSGQKAWFSNLNFGAGVGFRL